MIIANDAHMLALESKIKCNKLKLGFFAALLCIVAIIATIPIVAGQEMNSSGSYIATSSPSSVAPSPSTKSTTDLDRVYCVKMGGLYRTGLSVNNGKGFCQFGGNSGCDAHALFNGSCGPNGFYNPYGTYYLNYNPYPYYDASPNGLSYGKSSVNYCRNNGGFVQRVHTSYGDVDQCIFPNGNVMALYGLSNRSLDNWSNYGYTIRNPPTY